ncbi:hypothetical protein BC939DRAFT_158543 [Gamsiella multidivaricata]|uniref:uncharacterized protein n=1 Tax=Gamsiella multidivaricata TaxID=101098 RepID=UPI0022212780|nr:uncharacterized protein BC939DRAFT_158543 [Gamsiella multidivaricata]KAG0355215.1 hypothetical protein BGZ54_001253 [Gamsiella multidivaricata]KAI7823525.1 hypothetical protein BC939DRAFT_158543 [Gamsiella multidivaricata]
MPHLIKTRPSTTGPATAGIGTPSATSTTAASTTSNKQHLSLLTTDRLDSSDYSSDYSSYSDSDLSDTDTDTSLSSPTSPQHRLSKNKKYRRRDIFSTLPAPILQQILSRLPPFQMLTISELSRKFYNLVVHSQEMNEVWFRLMKFEETEEKKRLDWYRQKKLEQELRSTGNTLTFGGGGVAMGRSFSSSSTCSNMSTDEPIMSKHAQRLLYKKQEAAGKSSGGMTVKPMKRSDRKKNWCKIYVDAILRGNSEDPMEALSKVVPGSSKRPSKFQTIVLNEPLPEEHFREYRNGSINDDNDENDKDKPLSREAKTQAKLEKRMYYKSIRSKPKGKKAGQLDSAAAKVEKIAPWRQPEWSEQDQLEAGDY